MALRMNIQCYFIVGDFFVRKLTDEMSCDASAEFPSRLLCERYDVREELAASDILVLIEKLLAVSKGLSNILLEFVLQWIVAEHKGPPKVRLPFLKDRPQVEKQNVIFSNSKIGRIFGVGSRVFLPARTIRLCQ